MSSSRAGSEDSEQQQLAWYEDPNMVATKKGENRWKTLRHNGPYFTGEYKPHGVPIEINGVAFPLSVAEEEVATFYAVMRESPYYRKPLFQNNFIQGFVALFNKTRGRGNHPFKTSELAAINFDRIWEWHVVEKTRRDALPKEEKKKLKDAANKEMEPFQTCVWDGRKERVANFRVEPPGLFRGRGDHPKQGMIKERVNPEDVTINIGAGEPVPVPPAGHKWKEVIHDQTVTWLAFWVDNVNGNHKYVMLHPSAAIKGLSDREKFEKARELKKHVDKIRNFYRDGWNSEERAVRQKCVAMYFIDKLALRVGNEKDDDEADTVGCCSLRCEHVSPIGKADGAEHDYTLHFDFLGKDSIRYVNDVVVEPRVWQLIGEFRHNRPRDKDLFPDVDSSVLNDEFKRFMPGLTAKVFRTYNASITLENELKANPVDAADTVANKMLEFTKANTRVAILCNHQKTVSKAGHISMRNMEKKKEYSEHNVKILEECAKIEEDEDTASARKHYVDEHIKLQDAWVDKYATDEEKQAWAEEKERLLEDLDSSPVKAKLPKKRDGAVVAKRTRDPKLKRAAAVTDSDDEDDQPLFAVLAATKKKAAPAAGKAKKDAAPAAKAKKDQDSDDELLLAAFGVPGSSSAKKNNNNNNNSTPAAKNGDTRGGKKSKAEVEVEDDESVPSASESEDDEEHAGSDEGNSDDVESSSSEEEEEQEEEEEEKSTKKGKATPAAKKGAKKTAPAASKKKAPTPSAKKGKKATPAKKSPAGKKKPTPKKGGKNNKKK